MRRLWPLLFLSIALSSIVSGQKPAASRFGSYVINPQQQPLQLFYQDDHGQRLGSIQHLKTWLAQRHQTLLFAMNGGMYSPGGAPKGLFIQGQKLVTPLDTARGTGNFYLKPNGVLYLTTDRQAGICPTGQFRASPRIAYATQSGPLLLVRGQINPTFTQGSANAVVRNGVGILPGGRLVFVISRGPVNFYDFAIYFRRLGCREALYFDGFVSRMYAPAQGWRQVDGDFGVIVGVSVAAKK